MAAFPSLRDARNRWLGSGAWILAAIAAVAAVALIGFALAHGSIRVIVTARDGSNVQRLQVFVDNAKVDCQGTPCMVSQQKTGIHRVKVLADGFALPAAQVCRVFRNQNTSLRFSVEPLPSLGLKVAGQQPDLTLFVDQKAIGNLPREIGLTAGAHWVRVTGGEGYEPFEERVELAPGQLTDLGVITLKVREGRVKVLTGPIAGARVFIEGKSGRRELTPANTGDGYATLSLDARQPWWLVATKDGYADYRQAISFEDGQRDKTYTVTLTRENPILSDDALRPPPLSGPLDDSQIRETVARYTGSVKRACWQAALDTRERDAPTAARVVVTIVVWPSGAVQSATTAADPKGYRGLSACVAARVRGWQFPPSGSATTVNVPFAFATQ